MEHRLKGDEKAIRELVRRELQNAVDNDEIFEGWTTQQIAEDLCEFSPEAEGLESSDVLPHIEEWRKERTQ